MASSIIPVIEVPLHGGVGELYRIEEIINRLESRRHNTQKRGRVRIDA
jgi:hypothetical protein